MTVKTKKYIRCKAGATYCTYKRNSDVGFVVCSLGEAARDAHGNKCPHQVVLEVVM